MEKRVTETAEAQRSRGMRDLLPDEMERVRAVESAFAAACRAWDYREVRTPTIEPLHLFTSAGTLSPQTLDRVYSFLDWDGWSGERVVLRPDSTIPAARLYAEQLDGGRTARLFYRQNVFRFTGDGPSREEWQCGVELIGAPGPAGDVELVLLALEALSTMGIESPSLRLSHPGIARAVLAAAGLTPDEASAAYDRLLDGDLSVVDEMEARLPQLDAPLRLLFEVEGAGSGYISNVREALGASLPALVPPLDELAFVVEALETLDVQPIVQAVLARSFEYYSGTVMRFDVEGRTAGAGGRYDELIGLVGGKPVPASGFALHVSPLTELVRTPASAERVCISVEPAEERAALIASAHAMAARLRAAGMRASVDSTSGGGAPRIACRAQSPRFELAWDGATRTFDDIDQVVRALAEDHP